MIAQKKTILIVMSLRDFHNTKIDSIFDPNCRSGYYYIIHGEDTPACINTMLQNKDKEIEYWKSLAKNRLKGIIYWKNKWSSIVGKSLEKPIIARVKEKPDETPKF